MITNDQMPRFLRKLSLANYYQKEYTENSEKNICWNWDLKG